MQEIINYSKYYLIRSEYTPSPAKGLITCMYLSNLKNKFKSDPKSFYRFVNSKHRAAVFPSAMKLGTHESSDNNLFAEFFAATYSSSTFNANNQIIFLKKRTLMYLLLINVLFPSIYSN